MKKLLALIVVLALVFAATMVMADDKKPEAKTYYQYQPSQTLPPGSIWNPIITEKSDGSTYKSYYKLPDSKTTQQGSIWNPLLSTEVKKGGKK